MEEQQQPKKVKKLPRTASGKFKETFEANGTTYRILDADRISIAKWNTFRRYSAMALAPVRGDSSFRLIRDTRAALDAYTRDKASLGGAYAALDSYEKGLMELSEDKRDPIFSACSCFVIPDGGNEVDFIQSVAERSIADWEAEGYAVADFFFLFLTYLSAQNEHLAGDTPTDSGRITGTD